MVLGLATAFASTGTAFSAELYGGGVEVSPATRRLYQRSTAIDCLSMPSAGNIPWPPVGPFTPLQLDSIRQSGLSAVNVTVGDNAQTFDQTLRSIAFWNSQVRAHSDLLSVIDTGDDIRAAKRSGRLGLIYGTQDTTMLEGRLANSRALSKAGIRILQLTYNKDNEVGSGCLSPVDKGLTEFGHRVVDEVPSDRLVLDLSHGASGTSNDAIRAVKAPPIISHIGCRAVNNHPRNASDETLRLVAQKGGVVGIYFMPYLSPPGERVTPTVLVRHLAHALDVCGEDHVGIGSDLSVAPIVEDAGYKAMERQITADRKRRGVFAPGDDRPLFIAELNTPRRLELVAELLSKQGYKESLVEKVLGANFLRVFDGAWAGARA